MTNIEMNPSNKRWILYMYVVPGFTRQCADAKHVPIDILMIIQSLHSLIKIWNIERQYMRLPLNLSACVVPLLPTFDIDNITFHCNVFPNGFANCRHGFIQFQLRAKSIPKQVKKIRIYFELICITTQTVHRGVKVFRKSGDAAAWRASILKWSECRHYESLCLVCYLDILRVEYRQSISYADYCKPLVVKSHIDLGFNFDTNVCVGSYVVSDTFGGQNDNHCWWLTLEVLKKNRVRIMLRLFRLPMNLKGLIIRFKVTNGRKDVEKSHVTISDSSALSIPGHFGSNHGQVRLHLQLNIISGISLSGQSVAYQ
eukprot:336700_1